MIAVSEVCPVCHVVFAAGAREVWPSSTKHKVCPNGHSTSDSVLRRQRKARAAAIRNARSNQTEPQT